MKILVVEDNQQIMETLCDFLEFKGHQVDCAYHGEAALTMLQQQRFDIIIMDIMMPKLDGIQTVNKLRHQLHINTPILFLTARDTLDDKLAAFAAGGDDYLVKPFGSFVSAIREIESKSLEVCQKMQTRGVNELFVNDSSGELQFLRRSLLSGGHKFKGKFEQIAPVALFDAFESRINNVQELVVIGYGFGDEHVNEVMLKWLSNSNNHLTICNPYCEGIPDFLKAYQAQVQIAKKGLTDYLLSVDPSKDTPKRKAQRDLIQYLETLSPEEITGLVKSDLHHQYWTPS